MANTIKKWEGAMPALEAALQESEADYTPGSGRKLIIQGFWVYNANAADKYGNIKIGTTILLGNKQIPTTDTIKEFDMNCPLFGGEKIYVKGEVADDLKYRIWGIEVDA